MNERQLGQQLADAFPAHIQAVPARTSAVLHDLLGADVSLLAPLKDLVSRPGFQALAAMRFGNGSTRARRDALLQGLAETYQPQVVNRLGDFLDGFLEPPPAADARPPAAVASPPAEDVPPSAVDVRPSAADLPPSAAFPAAPAEPQHPAMFRSMAVAETVILDENATDFDGDFAEDSTSAAEGSVSAPASEVSPTGAAGQGQPPWASGRAILALGLGVALAGLGGLGLLRGNLLCSPLGLCSAEAIKSATVALERAQAAASTLGKAADLAAYDRSLRELEGQLDKIESEAGLSDRQRDLRKRLQTQRDQARTRLTNETRHRRTVQDVRKESATISKLAPQAAEERRRALRGRLASVPAQSFAASQAKELRQQLEPPPPPPITTAGPASGSATWQGSPVAPPQRWSAPARERYSSGSGAASAQGGAIGAPYREEPIW